MEFIYGFTAADRDAASLGLDEASIFHLVRQLMFRIPHGVLMD
jgi:hypothetical protein